MITIENYRNPRYNKSGTIDCEIEHPEYGWIPFTASPNDCEKHGVELFLRIKMEGTALPYTPPSDEEISLQVRIKRNTLLKRSDWTQLPDVPESIKTAWSKYRQELRDITLQSGFPNNIVWPEEPK